jgi:adenylate kinase
MALMRRLGLSPGGLRLARAQIRDHGDRGSGKGTQAGLLARDFDLTQIGVGDIFRWHVQAHTKIGAHVRRIMASGELVDDDLVESVVNARLLQHDWNFGFILDGFPRNARQAEFFLESYDIDAVIHLELAEDEVRRRVLSRRLCAGCGMDYNVIGHRPKQPDTCDVCGGALEAREDDTEEALDARLRDWHDKTDPILDLMRRKEKVVSVDAGTSVEKVQQAIRSALGLPDFPG